MLAVPRQGKDNFRKSGPLVICPMGEASNPARTFICSKCFGYSPLSTPSLASSCLSEDVGRGRLRRRQQLRSIKAGLRAPPLCMDRRAARRCGLRKAITALVSSVGLLGLLKWYSTRMTKVCNSTGRWSSRSLGQAQQTFNTRRGKPPAQHCAG